jgi:hypothetical protein
MMTPPITPKISDETNIPPRGKHISITRTSRTTATRDLQDLVTLGALIKTRELRHTCYTLIAAHFQHSGAADRSSRLAARSTARCSRENTNPSTTN